MESLVQFTAGALVLGFCVAGLVFLRFFRKTGDRLFALFGASFFMMAANRAALAFVGEWKESHTALYLLRLLAFLVILFAILDKNVSLVRRRGHQKPTRVSEPSPPPPPGAKPAPAER